MRSGPKVMVSSGDIVNPTDGQVLIDSGALPAAGAWLLSLVGFTDAAFKYRVISVNANLVLAKRFPAAGDVDLLIPNHQPFVRDEIIRVISVGNQTANLHLTLHGVLVE